MKRFSAAFIDFDDLVLFLRNAVAATAYKPSIDLDKFCDQLWRQSDDSDAFEAMICLVGASEIQIPVNYHNINSSHHHGNSSGEVFVLVACPDKLARTVEALLAIGSCEFHLVRPSYDLFVCHASEDKDRFVRPLAELLRGYGLRVWYDEFELAPGDSLRERIDDGLEDSLYGLVVLSPYFFSKKWPRSELNGLFALEDEERKVILPVWYNLSREQILAFSPMLADRLAIIAMENDVEGTATKIREVLEGANRGGR